jgi:Glutathione-dependent formaldehyde-activating enzyme
MCEGDNARRYEMRPLASLIAWLPDASQVTPTRGCPIGSIAADLAHPLFVRSSAESSHDGRLSALRPRASRHMTLQGGRYCGKVRYAAAGKPMLRAQPHCRPCQYFSGGAANMFLLTPVDGFRYTKGEPRRVDLERAVTREFCGAPHSSSAPGGFPQCSAFT